VLELLRRKRPRLVGILNLTDDSFSDGGRYLDPERAIAHAETLLGDGADLVELGPAASNPQAASVSAEEEIRRITPVMDWLLGRGTAVAVDSSRPQTQAYAIERGAACLNDVEGFAHPAIYAALARATCRLVVVHALQQEGRAVRIETDPLATYDRMQTFLTTRLAALEAAGVARDRLIIDPGMGLFLGSNPEPSLHVLARIGELRSRFGLPILVSVSRKSFLGTLTGRPVAERGAATLSAELYAAASGVDYLRTHDVAALRDGLAVLRALAGAEPESTAG
jgi:dihydropteroate synthase type 2